MMQLKIYIKKKKKKEEIIILVYMVVILLEITKRGWNWNIKRGINWINDKLFISNKMDVILKYSSINTINENERIVIITNNTGNYSDDPTTIDSNSNNNSHQNLQS